MNFSELNGGTAIQINDFDIRDINEESAEIIKGYLYENVVVVLKSCATQKIIHHPSSPSSSQMYLFRMSPPLETQTE